MQANPTSETRPPSLRTPCFASNHLHDITSDIVNMTEIKKRYVEQRLLTVKFQGPPQTSSVKVWCFRLGS
jgi:hypothetical protein